ncbi:hypothetical protein MMC28_004208 [Mycoblastus sanguinarius]|nr:hypothetical protein [Mycoblastus sanguinarius]
MSMEIDSPQLAQKTYKKSKDKDGAKSQKKRKRITSDDLEPASPTKKHRSEHRTKSPITHVNVSEPLTTPEVSPFFQETFSLYLPLPPISQNHALQGICAEHLSPLILTYYPPFHGIIVSYANVRLSTEPIFEGEERALAQAIDEYAASFIWLTADFLIFRPQKGTVIEGYVNLQNESNIGLVCWNFFNASIERKQLVKEWKWIPGGVKTPGKRKLKKAANGARTDLEEDDGVDETMEDNPTEDAEGYFQDAKGKKIGGLIRFRVKSVETSRSMDRDNGFLSIQGTILNEGEERELQEQDAIRLPGRKEKQLGRNNEPKDPTIGALPNGYDGVMDIEHPPTPKHKAKY